MADNSVQTGADTIRDKDRAGVKTQIVGLDLTPAGATETLMAGTLPVSVVASTYLYRGRAGTFRTPGRAGVAGQKLLSIFNATGSGRVVTVNNMYVDLTTTVVKAVTVLPPVIRVYRIAAAPTGGTALTKVAKDSALTSSASVTLAGDASVDGTSSTTALTAVTTAGATLTQEFAPRLITAAGYEMFDRTEFFSSTMVTVRPGEGLVLALDYTLATQNPVTDMWVASVDWDEA